jgi:hypothetical protein
LNHFIQVLHEEFDSGFLVGNLTGFGPFFTDFFQLVRVCDIPLEVTAIRTDIIIKCGNGNNADGDTVAAEGAAFRHDLNSRIDFFGSAFGAFSLFQVNTSLIVRLDRLDRLERLERLDRLDRLEHLDRLDCLISWGLLVELA